MSGTESFLTRWSRLKRKPEVTAPAEGPSPPEGESAPEHVTPSEDASSISVFDAASLPSIESIVADSDIRQFLHAGVPPELTRAALRSAWSADPAIRDFIGIAESQWDFNDAAAMPGFGPVRAADYLAAQMLESAMRASQNTAADSDPVTQPAQYDPAPRRPNPVDDVPAAALASTPTTQPQPQPQPQPSDEPVLAESTHPSPSPHSHGSALPK
jgi:Protein of unknown function (DUF3306)